MYDTKSGNLLSDQLDEMVAMARTGDQEAISVLYEQTYSNVYYTIRSMIKDGQDVLDILQDTYIKVFTHLNQLEGNERFLPWVRQIAANTARDFLKKKRPMLFTDLNYGDEQDTPVEEQFIDERSGYIPDVVIEQAETKRLIQEMIDSLPEDQRAVIGMYYYHEMSVKDIAVALGVSESAVKSRLMYGRKKIEAKVLDLEKRGTKLYGLAPIPFLLWLLRSQEVYAAQLPNAQILQNVLAGTAEYASSAAGASYAVVSAGAFGISRLSQKPEKPSPVVAEERTSPETAVSVTEEPTSSADTEQQESEPEKSKTDQAVEEALEQYRRIVNQADSYTYSHYSVTPTGNYRYALVRMQPADSVPTLLLLQEGDDYTNRVRVFQYDLNTQTVRQPEEALEEYGGSGGYSKSGLTMEGDGNGIRLTEISGGTGDTEITRITLSGNLLHREKQWSGRMDEIPDSLSYTEISWYDIKDTAALDSWTPGRGSVSKGSSKAVLSKETVSSKEAVPSDETDTETALPEDGNRIVFKGTIDTYNYKEVIELQGCPDPNGEWSDHNQTFRLIVLDTPQTMELQGVDGPRSGEVRLIAVSYAEGLEKYDGQHQTFSIDPRATYWPSDTSMPVGQPSTNDVKVLE